MITNGCTWRFFFFFYGSKLTLGKNEILSRRDTRVDEISEDMLNAAVASE